MVAQNSWEWPTNVWFSLKPKQKEEAHTLHSLGGQKRDNPETWGRIKHYESKTSQEMIPNGILLYLEISTLSCYHQRGFSPATNARGYRDPQPGIMQRENLNWRSFSENRETCGRRGEKIGVRGDGDYQENKGHWVN